MVLTHHHLRLYGFMDNPFVISLSILIYVKLLNRMMFFHLLLLFYGDMFFVTKYDRKKAKFQIYAIYFRLVNCRYFKKSSKNPHTGF